MPTELEVPETQKRALAKLIGYSKKDRDSVLSALREMKPHRLRRYLASDLASKVRITEDEANEMIALLASLYVSFDRSGESKTQFLDEVSEAMRAAARPELVPPSGDWAEFKAFLAEILSLDASLGVTAKAQELILETEHLYCGARVLTDLRPVYGLRVDEGPNAALVLHQLKLSFHEGGPETKDFYITLEKPDIEELRKVLDRASRKEESLRVSAKKGGMNVLDG
jgi:hypothetical protein